LHCVSQVRNFWLNCKAWALNFIKAINWNNYS
jgi:hypothetical protein